MKSSADLTRRLSALHDRTAETPLFNPVFQLSLDISRALESGAMTLADAAALVAELECESLQSRAARLVDLLGPMEPDLNLAAVRQLCDGFTHFTDFAGHWASPLFTVVLTAHPTFLLGPAQARAVATAASSGEVCAATVCSVDPERPAITLDFEHEAAMAALVCAQDARDAINRTILREASARWPESWRKLRPQPFRFATWVGYDMDGRTDIGWATSIRFRLHEKALRLARYADAMARISPDHPVRLALSAAHDRTRAMEALFAGDLTSPEALSQAANRLTEDHPDKLLSLAPLIAALEDEAASGATEQAVELLVLASAMRADGLGMGGIHFRVNSSQLSNAIRRRIDPDNRLDLSSKVALVRMRELLAEVVPLRANFAALAIENTTAVRQFLAMAQILHHIDAEAPIRMLVAECEQPTTILAALYFARLFGIEGKVDVSPLRNRDGLGTWRPVSRRAARRA